MIYLVLKFLFMEEGTVKKSVYDFSGEESFKKALSSFHTNCTGGIATEGVVKVSVALIDENLNVHRTEKWESDSEELSYAEVN